ncbi:MAG: diacylglycerol kinase [Kangiellaceae bacterium]|nr:diacylglycerol kinase [Kangiellaceae bacterium]
MTKPGKTGIARIFAAAGYSLKGLKAAWVHEEAFRQELLIALIGVPLAFWLAKSTSDLLWLILPLFVLVMTELMNSAVEATIDRIGTEHRELSGRAKDIASAIVFVALIMLVFIWVIVLVPIY